MTVTDVLVRLKTLGDDAWRTDNQADALGAKKNGSLSNTDRHRSRRAIGKS